MTLGPIDHLTLDAVVAYADGEMPWCPTSGRPRTCPAVRSAMPRSGRRWWRGLAAGGARPRRCRRACWTPCGRSRSPCPRPHRPAPDDRPGPGRAPGPGQRIGGGPATCRRIVAMPTGAAGFVSWARARSSRGWPSARWSGPSRLAGTRRSPGQPAGRPCQPGDRTAGRHRRVGQSVAVPADDNRAVPNGSPSNGSPTTRSAPSTDRPDAGPAARPRRSRSRRWTRSRRAPTRDRAGVERLVRPPAATRTRSRARRSARARSTSPMRSVAAAGGDRASGSRPPAAPAPPEPPAEDPWRDPASGAQLGPPALTRRPPEQPEHGRRPSGSRCARRCSSGGCDRPRSSACWSAALVIGAVGAAIGVFAAGRLPAPITDPSFPLAPVSPGITREPGSVADDGGQGPAVGGLAGDPHR